MADFVSSAIVKESVVMRQGNGSSLASMLMGEPAYRDNIVRLHGEPTESIQSEKSVACYTKSKNKFVFYVSLDSDVTVTRVLNHPTYPHLLKIRTGEPTGDSEEEITFAVDSEEELDEWVNSALPAVVEGKVTEEAQKYAAPIERLYQPMSEDTKEELFDHFVYKLACTDEDSDEKEDFNVKQWWGTVAEEDGSILKPKFIEIISQYFVSKAHMDDTVIAMCDDMGIPEGPAAKLKEKLSKKLLEWFPVLSETIFNFFDADGSGSISQLEVRNAAAFIASVDKDKWKSTMGLEQIAELFFRMFDTDGSGNVEAGELSSRLGSILGNIITFIVTIVTDLAPYIVAGPVQGSVRMMFEMFAEGEDEIAIADLAKKMVGGMLQEQGGSASTKIIFNNIKKMFTKGLMVYGEVVGILTSVFDEKATDGEIPKEEFVDALYDEVLAPMVDGMLSEGEDEIVGMGVAMLSEMFGEEFVEAALPNLQAFASSFAEVSKDMHSTGVLKDFCTAFVDVVDVNNDGVLSRDEVIGLLNSIMELSAMLLGMEKQDESNVFEEAPTEYSEESYLGAIEKVIGAFAKLADADNNGKLDADEMVALTRKVVALVMTLIKMFATTAKSILGAVFEPAFALIMRVKANYVGGASDSLTQEDFVALLKLELTILQKEWR